MGQGCRQDGNRTPVTEHSSPGTTTSSQPWSRQHQSHGLARQPTRLPPSRAAALASELCARRTEGKTRASTTPRSADIGRKAREGWPAAAPCRYTEPEEREREHQQRDRRPAAPSAAYVHISWGGGRCAQERGPCPDPNLRRPARLRARPPPSIPSRQATSPPCRRHLLKKLASVPASQEQSNAARSRRRRERAGTS